MPEREIMTRQSGVLIFAVFACILAMTLGSRDSLCLENSKPCLQNEDCCDGCCFKEKCVVYSDSCVRESNPCSSHVCPPNTVCYLQKVMCIQAPCPPIPACKPIDYDDYE